MKIYDVSRLASSITLGWDGENNWRPIAFDCSALLTGHPDAVVTLWLLPKGEAQAFPVALERDANTVTWTPLNEEMTAERGQFQIVVQDGTDVGKSKVIDYIVRDSLVGGADHPAETPSWAVQVVEDVTAQADRAVAAGDSIDPESLEQTISEAIADYLEENPVEVTETDPTVPAWAKQPNKPTYTAQEVGALPDSYTPPVQSVNGKTGAVVLDASDVGALPDDTVIPAAVTESTVSGWGFTKNTGDYTKPSTGIPKSDLAADVKTSLGKADKAFEVVNVKDYGAVGDGETDDSTAFANAIAAVPSGGALYVPSGVYVVQNVELKSHMTIFGDGFSSEIQLSEELSGTVNGNCLTVNGTSSTPITDVHIRDLKLSGARSTQTSTGHSADQRLNGIHVRYAEEISINHVWMTDNGYHGLIATYTKRTSVTDCLSTANGFRPIHFHDGCEDILISGNTCLNNGLGVSGGSGNLNDGILVFGIARCTISCNTVKSNENGGIIASHASTGVTISNNVVECYSLIANSQTSAGSCGIYLEGGLSDFTVSGNVLRHAYRGIYLYGSTTEGRVLNGTITGNSIADCHIGINFNLLAEGIACNNNSFYNCINKAIELNRCKHVSFSGNEILVDSTIQDTTLAPAAVSFYQAVECVVADNVMNLASHYRYGVRVYGTDTTYTGTGNEVKNNTINAAQTSGTLIEVSGNLASMNVINGVLTDMPTELPTVTAADNGKFLCVVSGAWAAATVPSAESNSFGGGA